METENLTALERIETAVEKTSAPVYCLAAALSQVQSSLSFVTLAAFNPQRKGMIIANHSTATLYIAFSSAATLTAFTINLPSMSIYEMDFPIYVGQITGIWDGNNGIAQITELS